MIYPGSGFPGIHNPEQGCASVPHIAFVLFDFVFAVESCAVWSGTSPCGGVVQELTSIQRDVKGATRVGVDGETERGTQGSDWRRNPGLWDATPLVLGNTEFLPAWRKSTEFDASQSFLHFQPVVM